jgi:hypothetical protein
MALTKGVNSYADVTDADTYFADRLDAAAWTAADVTAKSQALVTATGVLENMSWTGVAMSPTQDLAFPRYGTYFDPRIGTRMEIGDSTPPRVFTASIELAYHFLNNDGILDNTGTVKDIEVGSIKLTEVIAPNLIPGIVKRLIKPLLVNAGANSWWRAN